MNTTDETEELNLVEKLADELAERLDADILLFNADIERETAQQAISLISSLAQRRKNVALILVTHGGDPDGAFLLGRYLHDKYERILGFVPGMCKSAGTLVMHAAHELIISDTGELGPLDIQVAKSDELGTMNSGLTATTALDELRSESFQMFEKTFLAIKRKSYNQVSFRMATEIAANLTVGLFSPIFSQIQAMHIGEVGRANLITRQYGQLLAEQGENLKPNGIARLAFLYPSHGFVIDRKEAKKHFYQVRIPSDLEDRLFSALGECAQTPLADDTSTGHYAVIEFVSSILDNTPTNKDEESEHGSAANDNNSRRREDQQAEQRRPLSPPRGNDDTDGDSSTPPGPEARNGTSVQAL